MHDLEEPRNEEKAGTPSPGLLTPPDGPIDSKSTPSSFQAITWMTVNTLATVFTNKALFLDPQWKQCQLTFAFLHFLMTWFTLFLLSRSSIGVFVPRPALIHHTMPLATAMCFNVILPNLSLAYSTVTFYQIARIVLTPTVAVMNFILYREVLPREAILSLIPACLGVGMVTYYDSLPTDDETIKTTSTLGIIFAFTGIFASSLYTVWIAAYHRKLGMNSMQLLYAQAPIACLLLAFFNPFFDKLELSARMPRYPNAALLVLASMVLASLINISQFYIVAQTGPVSSTVVGHVKTCTIVGLGWILSGRPISDKSALGVVAAITGIAMYSIIMLKHKRQKVVGCGAAATAKV
ncbi:triose-phosphate transporter family domain-containing protein [Trichoderma austrokoningii]